MIPPADLRARVLEAARSEPSLPRRRVVLVNLALAGAAVCALLSVFLTFGGGIHRGLRPSAFVAGTALGWACVALLATWIALGRGRSMLGRPRLWLAGAALATPALLFAWMLVWNALYPETLRAWAGRPGFLCLDFTLAMGAWPLVALVLARRSSDPVHPRATGAALGAMVGAWTGSLINVNCRIANPAHVALGHVLPVVILVALGAWLGKRFIMTRVVPARELGAIIGASAGAWIAMIVDLRGEIADPSSLPLWHIALLVTLGALGAWLGTLVAGPREITRSSP